MSEKVVHIERKLLLLFFLNFFRFCYQAVGGFLIMLSIIYQSNTDIKTSNFTPSDNCPPTIAYLLTTISIVDSISIHNCQISEKYVPKLLINASFITATCGACFFFHHLIATKKNLHLNKALVVFEPKRERKKSRKVSDEKLHDKT